MPHNHKPPSPAPELGRYYDHAFEDLDSLDAPIYESFLHKDQRYKNLEDIDIGGSKKISAVFDELTSRPVAMAQLRDIEEKNKYENFLSEAFLTATLEHPNIIPLYDAGLNDKDQPYFTMKLVEGSNLRDLIKKASTLESINYTLQEVIDIFLKICDAISFAHSKNIIHLDLKPDNIRLGYYGEVLVCDWGIAKIIEDEDYCHDSRIDLDPNIINDHTLDGILKGTPGYMAPEQFDASIGDKSRQTDIYQLGGILYSLLTLEKPIQTKSAKECATKTIAGDIVSPSKQSNPHFKIPESLAAVTMKALSREPDDRYASVNSLKQEVLKWRDGFATQAENASFFKAFALLLKRHRLLACILFIFLCLSTFFMIQIRTNEQAALRNAALARQNEEKAIKALALYQQEKIHSLEAGIAASPRLTQVGIEDMRRGRFQYAKQLFLKARKLDPSNDLPLYFLALIQFSEQNFLGMFNTLNQKRHLTADTKKLIQIAKKYKRIKGPRQKLFFSDLIKMIKETPFTRPAYLLALQHHQTHPPLKEKISLIKLIFTKTNPHIKNWNIGIENLPNGYNIDLSAHPYIRNLEALHGLPIKKLNLRYSRITEAEFITPLLVEEIDMRKTNISKLGLILSMPSLRKLTLSTNDHLGWNFADYPKVTVLRK